MRTILAPLVASFTLTTAVHASSIAYTTALFDYYSTAATGTVKVSYDEAADALRVEATFDALVGTTTAANLRCCASPWDETNGIAMRLPGFPSGVTSGSYDSGWLSYPALKANLLDTGDVSFWIETTRDLYGEMQGYVTRVPAPAAISLLAAAVLVLVACRRLHRSAFGR